MNPGCAISAAAIPVYFGNQGLKFAVFQRTFRRFSLTPGIKTAGGDTQHPAHEHNNVVGLLLLHKQVKYYRALLFSSRVEGCRFF